MLTDIIAIDRDRNRAAIDDLPFPHVTAQTLSKLTRPQTAAMVSRLADGKALPDDLFDQILGKTDGAPLLVG